MLSIVESTTKKRGPKRQYSDEDKANALLVLQMNNGNVKIAAYETGIPYKTLANWRDGLGVTPAVAEIGDIKRKPLCDRLDELAHLAIDLLPEKMPSASVRDLVGVYGQSIEKSQLLSGKPTQINENRSDLNEVALAAYAKKHGLPDDLVQARAEIAKVAQDAGIPLSSELSQ